jgi:Fe-S cluster assembly protein SufD
MTVAVADTDDRVLPTGREEAWKYTPVAEIMAALRESVPGRLADVSRVDLDRLAGDLGGTRLVFVNGVRSGALSDVALPAGVRLGSAGRHGLRASATDGFGVLDADGPDGADLTVAPGVVVEEPIHVVHLSVPGDVRTASHPRTLVDIGDGATVTVVETYAGLPGAALTDASTTVRAGRGSTFEHVRVQAEPADAIHVGRLQLEQASSSQARLTSVMVGSHLARQAVDVRLVGADAVVELAGLYVACDRQRHDTVVSVEHAASRGRSSQRYKGVIDDHARGSFSGHVLVDAGTVGNDASQTNHNLVLSATAEADTRPWLEIFADDVRCTHGATVGRLDEDALFYLRSRGIPADLARALLVDAFVTDITHAVTHPAVRSLLAGLVARP